MIQNCVAFFKADEWPHEVIEDLPMVRSRYAGRHGNYDCWFQDRPNEQQLMFYARAPTNAVEDKRQAVAEFMTRANYGMVIGNFELDLKDGEMRYKASVDYEHIQVNNAFLKNMSYQVVVNMDRYLPGIMKLLYSDITPEEAVAEIEG